MSITVFGMSLMNEFCVIGQRSNGKVKKSGPHCHCEDERWRGCAPFVNMSAMLFFVSVQNQPQYVGYDQIFIDNI